MLALALLSVLSIVGAQQPAWNDTVLTKYGYVKGAKNGNVRVRGSWCAARSDVRGSKIGSLGGWVVDASHPRGVREPDVRS
jgi:hypothetical protein